ncbi:cytochrome c oxidase subunit 3 family protein [Nocardia gamkensis]|uniref:cytochrome c oxidase subunit 3 family protein n=1 Tax=Nocardia gamkensis TaxID=352869 RepID=UPI0037C7A8B9
MSATTEQPRTDIEERRRTPGEEGIWVFIFGDMIMFAVLFITFLYYRSKNPRLFADAQGELNQNFGATNTVVLLASSLFLVLAVRAVRMRSAWAPPLVAAALVCGLIFSVLKIVEYVSKVHHGITPATNNFFTFYYVMTGLHWFHLIIGMAVLSALLVLARRPKLSASQYAFFEGGACFWHMVDLLWIVLFPLLYLVR